MVTEAACLYQSEYVVYELAVVCDGGLYDYVWLPFFSGLAAV
ncbi:MAG: hypothetical protein NWE89_02630 [Candidatus Bathyarchaeota archaeon]|nr:hypothetical protein [Candidatus Bathyarchaeota archaeon]